MRTIFYKLTNEFEVESYNDISINDHHYFTNYIHINDINTHIISYKMKKYFASNQTILLNAFGKPIINHGHFNISHDKNCCVGIFDHKNPIGIDVVYKNRNIDMAMLNEYFTQNEPCTIEQWCKKEAYSKMIGKGLSLNFQSFQIIDDCIYDESFKKLPYQVYSTFFHEFFICVIGIWKTTEQFTLHTIEDVLKS